MRTAFGRIYGWISYKAMKRRRYIAIDNLTQAFPEKSAAEIEKIALGTFQNLGITFLELFAMSTFSDDELHKMIDFGNGIDLINDVRKRGKGILFLSGHFGNWELIAYSVGIFADKPITIVVKPQANESADKLLNEFRTARGNAVISMYNAARKIIKVVRNGEIIALLADQAAAMEDIFVNFFGRPASTYKVVADLALRYEIPIIMGFAIRQSDGTYKAELSELVYSDIVASDCNKADKIKALTERHSHLLEDVIRKYPDQWAWMHKRWKHKPKV
jgi:KDO2-lipid IV(A) lauroyltransferase